MITLYIKTHLETGLKYFGKTKRKDIDNYLGSGLYWNKHIKKYGKNIKTEIIGQFEDLNECEKFALEFSIKNDIINSNEWANLKLENGKDGAPIGNILSQETKNKISKKLMGKSYPKCKYVIKENDEIRKQRYKNRSKNTFWINDGNTNKRLEFIPEGWIKGRLGKLGDIKIGQTNKNGNNTRGKKIYNNGIKHAYFYPNQEPLGWKKGKMEGYQGGTGAMKKNAKRKKI